MQSMTNRGMPVTIPAERIIEPDHPDFDVARQVWNGMVDHRPAVIVRATSTEDVVAALAIARAAGLSVSIRGGGHNVAGLAVGDGALVVDLSAMRSVEVDVDRRRVRVGGGARWRDVDAATQAHALAAPGGMVSDTGVAGLTLSGGMGWLRSKHGLSCDALRSAQVVVADGRILRATEDENPDLLWALKGGGGNFGVVTELEFELFPVGPIVATSIALYPIDEAGARLRDFRDLVADLPDEVSTLADLAPIPDDDAFPGAMRGHGGLIVMGVAAAEPEAGARLLRPLGSLGGGAVADVGGSMPYADLQQFFDADYPSGTMRYYWKSSFANDLPDGMIDRLVDGFRRRPSHHSTVDFWPHGGAAARVSFDESAFGQRETGWLISAEANWEDPADDAANIGWDRDTVAEVGGTAYLNFPGLLEEGEQQARTSHGATFGRLTEVKRAYDPDNLFRFNANIPPAIGR